MELFLWYGTYVIILLIILYIFWLGVNSTWFQNLKMPDWQPTWFATIVIWFIVYGLSYVGLWLAYRDIPSESYLEMYRFILSLNLILLLTILLWFLTFFCFEGLQASIFVLDVVIIISLIYAYFISTLNPIGGLLQIPYLLWLGVYLALSGAYINLNPK